MFGRKIKKLKSTIERIDCELQNLINSTRNKEPKPKDRLVCLECGAAYVPEMMYIRQKYIYRGQKLYRCPECGSDNIELERDILNKAIKEYVLTNKGKDDK